MTNPWDALLLIPLYAYALYPALLRALPRRERTRPSGPLPRATAVVPVHNGGRMLEQRVRNLLSSDYPANLLDVLIVDDGSTDETASWTSTDPRVRVLRAGTQKGRANAHQLARQEALGEVMIFTDVDTEFSAGTVRALVQPFADPSVGCATGALAWKDADVSGVSRSMGLYWRFELWLREQESARGLLAVASGACMAVRTSLFPDLRLDEDIDCVAPLEAALRGHRVLHLPEASAFDRPSVTAGGELRGRVRMVALDFPATLRRLLSASALSAPGPAWAAASHKVARWLAAPCLFAHAAASLAAGPRGGVFAYAYGALSLVVVVGGASTAFRVRVPGATQLFSLFISQLAFTLGIAHGLMGAPERYAPAEEEPHVSHPSH